ncbi:MAG: hypothetical protein LBS72_03665 [Oscillospiraceae bacterium]|jgi:membrane-bound ClpP family serine protease|nr:hypothetical protein [Oscillospiraceae bacterium]
MLDIILLNLPILLCVLIGMALLIVEMFLPGFGVPGISGIALLFVGVFMTWMNAGPLAALGLFVMIVALTAIALTLVLRSTSRGALSTSSLVLREQSNPSYATNSDLNVLVGKTGSTLTPLRPAGMADIEGVRINVVSEGDFIPKGKGVSIDRIEGSRVIVKSV